MQTRDQGSLRTSCPVQGPAGRHKLHPPFASHSLLSLPSQANRALFFSRLLGGNRSFLGPRRLFLCAGLPQSLRCFGPPCPLSLLSSRPVTATKGRTCEIRTEQQTEDTRTTNARTNQHEGKGNTPGPPGPAGARRDPSLGRAPPEIERAPPLLIPVPGGCAGAKQRVCIQGGQRCK
jgi:hypothetical protein